MVTGIIGKKVGMTQLFLEDGTAGPGHGAPGRPLRRRAGEDGADRRLRGGAARPGRDKPIRRAPTRRSAGHFKKANVPPTRVRREVKVAKGARSAEARRPGAGLDLQPGRARRRRSAPARATASRASSSATTSAAATRRTARCSTARPARSAPRRIRRASCPACACTGTWAVDRVTVRNLKVLKVDAENNLLSSRRGARRQRRLRA